MSVNYIVYRETGEIISTGSCIERDILLQENKEKNKYVMRGVAVANDHYIKNGEILEKKKLNTSFEATGLVVNFPQLQEGTTVIVEDNEVTSDLSGIEIEFESAGVYWIIFNPTFEYKAEVVEVNVG